jgi:hypothetical protein
MRYREVENETLAMEVLCGKLSKEEEIFLRMQIAEKQEMAKVLQAANEETNKRFLAMEGAFSQLKQITGVSSMVDMHEKFSSQRGSKLSLLEEVRDAEARLEAAKTGQAMCDHDYDSAVRPSNCVRSPVSPTAASIGLLSDTAASTSHDSRSSSSSGRSSRSRSGSCSSQPAPTTALALDISSIDSTRTPTISRREGDVQGIAVSLSLSMKMSMSHRAEQTQTQADEFSREETNR